MKHSLISIRILKTTHREMMKKMTMLSLKISNKYRVQLKQEKIKIQRQNVEFTCNTQNLKDFFTVTQSGRQSYYTDEFQAK